MIDQSILDRLILARKNAGLSQSQVAKMLGLAISSSFTNIEKGTAALTLERFLKLCEIYDVDTTWVLTGVNPNFDPLLVVEAAERIRMAGCEMDDLLDLLAGAKA